MPKERGGGALFGFPNLLVGLNKPGGGDSSRSPTSPLDCRAFFRFGACLARSPRSPPPAGFDRPPACRGSDRVGLGLVDALLVDGNSCPRVVTSAASTGSLPRNYVATRPGGWPTEFAGLLLPEPTDLGRGRSSSGAGAERSSRWRKNPNLEAPHLEPKDAQDARGGVGAAAAARGFVGSLSPMDMEQSEDYTCIISHGPNPKTTRIFGGYILESYTSDPSDLATRREGDRGGAAPWILGSPEEEEPPPFFSAENFLSVCKFCEKKLEGKDVYMYGGERAFCSGSCRARQIAVEADPDEGATGSLSTSPGSTSCDEIFLLSLDAAA